MDNETKERILARVAELEAEQERVKAELVRQAEASIQGQLAPYMAAIAELKRLVEN